MKSIFQTTEWEQLKLQTGYQKSYRVGDILVLQKNLPLGRSMLYSPMVDLKNNKLSVTADFINQIKEIGQKENAIFYRLEIDTPVIADSQFTLQGFKKAFEEMQPEHTLILDISNSQDEILAQMKQKGRYNIKIGQKNNILIESSIEKGELLDNFYQLYAKTGSRHSITYRSKKYFEALLDLLGQRGYARVYSASAVIDGKKVVLAGAIILFFENRATYLYGGSSDDFKNMMAPYPLHWQIINEAKGLNMTEYDFFGISPNDDPKHPWSGVTRFKKQFGGTETQLIGSYDLIMRPLEYRAFKLAEKIRR